MFKWKVEELKLYNQKGGIFVNGKEKIYDCENEVSREDKIAFVDGMQDGKLSYLLGLVNKFNEDKEKLPKDNYGTVSLKSWIRKNDTKYAKPLIDDWFKYVNYSILGVTRNINYGNYHETYDDFVNDFVDKVFHKQLIKCEREEYRYFLEHDEYSILKEKFRNRNCNTVFGVEISEWSSGKICVISDSGEERDITIEELKILLDKYDKLEKYIEKLTSEVNIVY